LQSISASIEAVCRKTLQQANRDSEHKTQPTKNSVKNYMSAKVGWALASSIGWMLSFATHRSNESGKVILPVLSNPKVTPDEPPCPSVANPA
jgi:hypothetical protein